VENISLSASELRNKIMPRIRHTLLLSVLTLGTSMTSLVDVQAGCHGRSGGYSGGYSGGHSWSQAPRYHSSIGHAAPPIYGAPVPQYASPAPQYGIPEPVFVQSHSQFAEPRVVLVQNPARTRVAQLQQTSGGFIQPAGGTQSPAGIQQGLAGGAPMTQQVPGQNPVQPGTQLSASAPQTIGQPQAGTQPGGQVIHVQGQATGGQTGAALPVGGNRVPETAGISQQAVAGNSQPGTNASAVSSESGSPAASPSATGGSATGSSSPATDAQSSALEALGGFAAPAAAAPSEAPTQAASEQPSYVGEWVASLANGSRVQLSLKSDGNFLWTAANKDGKASSFQGSFTISDGSLSLARSSDNQKLSGSMATTGPNGFSFQLAGAKAPALEFVRN
jgi:hypothetical protein